MLSSPRSLLFVLLMPVLTLVGAVRSQDLPPPLPAPFPDQKGIEVQPRGPVHEGFAQPFQMQPEPGPIVPKQPPEPIPEVPPDMRPDGNNTQWIPGYWAWDSVKGEYLWVSGTYRNAPQGRQYVPGYWTRSNDGWRWVQGYWAPASGPGAPFADGSQYQPQYTPAPPAPLETGPNVAGPQDSIYYPGYWSYQNPSFAWRPGFYGQGYANRIWIPPHYVWTPAGYIFVPGYWDYPFANRGTLFAPVTFAQPYWNTPGWSYQPAYALNTSLFLNNLFWNGPSFYFGNYYGPAYAGLGFRPWYNAPYSPYLGYYRWYNRGNPGWYNGLNNGYLARAGGTLPLYARGQVVTPFNQTQQLARLNQAQIHAQNAAMVRSQQLSQQRLRVESTRTIGAAAAVAPRVQPVAPAIHSANAAYRPNTVSPALSVNHYHPATTHQATPAHHAATANHSVHHATPTYHASPSSHGRAVAPPSHHASAHHGGGHAGGHRR